ncbi:MULTISPECIES: hypothetical protein [unclassified Legionella]|uniref:hypothetical protein n=1 Tax=unclassified Legionella TaxID=2622702 RepID=UPI0010557CBB|nr:MULTISPECIES: hypothetical protein [unclassified Legionella]MDI9819122.1 hypothetical protein [Legionella sp. PL877]
MGNKIKAFFLALAVQTGFLGLFFLGGLLDPLIVLWLAVGYFFIIGFYLMYRYLLASLISGVANKHDI